MPVATRREDDIAKLKNMAQRKPPADIAAALGRSVGATSVKAHQLKVSLKMPRGWIGHQLDSHAERAPPK